MRYNIYKDLILMVTAFIVTVLVVYFATKLVLPAHGWYNEEHDNKVTICHCPDGNSNNCHTLEVGVKAALAHVKNHEHDYRGACKVEVTPTPTPSYEECEGQWCQDITPTPTEYPTEITPTPTDTPHDTPNVGGPGDGRSDGKSDGLGCGNHDCSTHPVVPTQAPATGRGRD